MKTHRNSFIKYISLTIILLANTASIHGVIVEPSRHEITASAGTTTQVTFSLSNSTLEIMTVSTSVRPYFPLATETAIPPESNYPYTIKSCESWITPDIESIQINPGEIKDFMISINVPANAAGEYAAYISFDQSADVDNSELKKMLDNDAKDAITDMELDLVLRRSVPVYIFIENTTNIQGELTDVTVNEMFTPKMADDILSFENNYIKIASVLKNTGSRHIRAKGSVVILDKQGNLITTIPTGITWPILPGYTETIPVHWECPKKEADYIGIINIELGNDIILQREIEFSVDRKGFLLR
ncbi:MAG: hypothetical protein RBU23_10875 [Candidatus Auribacterota bacterium]|nr:hypothetical protein [Candidatus Auribacterota bacterium]